MNRVTIILCFFSLTIFGETFDVEKLPELRTQQYPIGGLKKIVVFSLPRTGSSLVYNAFRYLFEAQENFSCSHNEFNLKCLVLKTHRFDEIDRVKNSDMIYVVTMRNPIDSIISHYRIYAHRIHQIREFVSSRIEMYMKFLRFYDELKKLGKNVIFLKYESFANDLGNLFEQIESHFAIQIDEVDKTLIEKGYGRENVLSSTEPFSDFEGYLPISGFHGSHIKAETYTPPKELTYWIAILLEKAKPEFRKYGYFLE